MTPRQYAEYQRQADVIEQHAKHNHMNNEYIIISKTAIQKRIEELEGYKDEPEITELKIYKEILSKSTPLIPEIEKAFDAGHRICKGGFMYIPSKRDYISNLKLDI